MDDKLDAQRGRAFNKIAFLQSEADYVADLLRRGRTDDAAHWLDRLSRGYANLASRLRTPAIVDDPMPEPAPAAAIFTDGTTRYGIVAAAIVVVQGGAASSIASVIPSADAHDGEIAGVLMAVTHMSRAKLEATVVTDSTEVMRVVYGKAKRWNTMRRALRGAYMANPFPIRLIERGERSWNSMAHGLCRAKAKEERLRRELTESLKP
jgi:hypothetical protein